MYKHISSQLFVGGNMVYRETESGRGGKDGVGLKTDF